MDGVRLAALPHWSQLAGKTILAPSKTQLLRIAISCSSKQAASNEAGGSPPSRHTPRPAWRDGIASLNTKHFLRSFRGPGGVFFSANVHIGQGCPPDVHVGPCRPCFWPRLHISRARLGLRLALHPFRMEHPVATSCGPRHSPFHHLTSNGDALQDCKACGLGTHRSRKTVQLLATKTINL